MNASQMACSNLHNAMERNATQCNATQRNATQLSKKNYFNLTEPNENEKKNAKNVVVLRCTDALVAYSILCNVMQQHFS